MKNIASEQKSQSRKCKLHPNVKCENCTNENCPFPYCQHMNCMRCENRYMCLMCHGECTNCVYSTYCEINNG